MATNILTDGTTNWSGGLDTSRSPMDIAQNQYSKACNVIIPSTMGGVSARFGIHCVSIEFEDDETRTIYRDSSIQGEGWFYSSNKNYLLCLADGYIFIFKEIGHKRFYASIININDRLNKNVGQGWIIQVPNGCIVNNGIDIPYYVTATSARRTDPSKGEIGIGRMGIYMQNRLFYVDQSAKRILASDAYVAYKFTLEGTNIFGFQCPDQDEEITAIGKQKIILGTVEGGNLIWSSTRDIYSADIRGTRSTWADLSSRIGKVTETIPGFSACSSNSFESFNTNIHFRSSKFGMADVRQSEYQFTQQEALNQQSIEASYYFNNDTDWMISRCYTRSCNNRLFTTVAPQMSEDGSVYWNGILSYNPAATYTNSVQNPRRFESVFTGVRPWCLTSVKSNESKDLLYIHSNDADGVNRLYVMDEESDFDINHRGEVIEILGFIETRGYYFENPFVLKNIEKRLYRLSKIDRTINIKFFSRAEIFNEWNLMWDRNHNVCRTNIEDGIFKPNDSHPQSRPYVVMPEEKLGACYPGKNVTYIQYRCEFTGPMNLEFFIATSIPSSSEISVSKEETSCDIITYEDRSDYYYSIATSN